ncbi:armadillo-type protein [Ochromonadaceae sp. CCMP2298]|nr:armadillo-type protein [Ochromonadaceae sp. CCMP2298]
MSLPEPPSQLAASLESRFTRDLNRTCDSDRSTRKRGLQKLLEDIPWSKKSQREELKAFVSGSMLKLLLPRIADSVEKCRELTLQILKRCLEKCTDISYDCQMELTVNLCARLGELPFPEPAEELRLLVLEVLALVQLHPTLASLGAGSEGVSAVEEKMVQMLTKGLTDGFPSSKRAGAELLCAVCPSSPAVVRAYCRPLLKALQTNAAHQHSKTRSVTLQAVGELVVCLGLEDYQALMRDPVLGILLRAVSDRTASVRVRLAAVLAAVLHHRISFCLQRGRALASEDFELVAALLLLRGDAVDEVAAAAAQQLEWAVRRWDPVLLRGIEGGAGEGVEDVPINASSAMDIDDGEVALIQAAQKERDQRGQAETGETGAAAGSEDMVDSAASAQTLALFVAENLGSVFDILHSGVEGWTTDSRRRYLHGLHALLGLAPQDDRLSALLPRMLSAVAAQARDEDGDVRGASELCCGRLGGLAAPRELLHVLLPRVAGAVAGGDTAAQRANAIAALTHVLHGLPANPSVGSSIGTETGGAIDDDRALDSTELVLLVAAALSDSSLHAFREASLRESALLLVRALSEAFPRETAASGQVQRALLLALVFLSARCPGEEDVVPDMALREMRRLAAVCGGGSADPAAASAASAALLGAHFPYLLLRTATAQLPEHAVTLSGSESVEAQARFYEALQQPDCPYRIAWEADSPAMAAFSVLLRECPYVAWEHHGLLLPLFTSMVLPKAGPAAGSAEAYAASYAAQRGEDIPAAQLGLVDARLHLIALMEGLIRAGTAQWECSQHIAAASAEIIRAIVVPNLVWRVGRVEATVRKVALALAYGILKAGAVKSDTLFKTAAELVPLIVSHLDDSEVTPRQMAVLCVTVIFERLRGSFSEQSVHEIYPKLVARLDDSSDSVRVAVCGAFVQFFQCADVRCYSSTTLDYTLDQLFLHLDDPEPTLQQAVLGALLQAAKLDKALVLRKAERNRSNHRTPLMCDRVVVEVTGVEILED